MNHRNNRNNIPLVINPSSSANPSDISVLFTRLKVAELFLQILRDHELITIVAKKAWHRSTIAGATRLRSPHCRMIQNHCWLMMTSDDTNQYIGEYQNPLGESLSTNGLCCKCDWSHMIFIKCRPLLPTCQLVERNIFITNTLSVFSLASFSYPHGLSSERHGAMLAAHLKACEKVRQKYNRMEKQPKNWRRGMVCQGICYCADLTFARSQNISARLMLCSFYACKYNYINTCDLWFGFNIKSFRLCW